MSRSRLVSQDSHDFHSTEEKEVAVEKNSTLITSQQHIFLSLETETLAVNPFLAPFSPVLPLSLRVSRCLKGRELMVDRRRSWMIDTLLAYIELFEPTSL